MKEILRPKFIECLYCSKNRDSKNEFCNEDTCDKNVPQAVVEDCKKILLYI